tara:strand:- start:1294 stop:2103 length:810 start_codon:yes stop_codon:yes gene_type:complete
VTENLKAYFLSDLHLESEEDSNFFVFESFLKARLQNQDLSHLFLLGDIFNLWVSDHKYFRQRFSKTLELLQQLVDKGVEVHCFEGNHDIDLEPYFESQGFKVHTSRVQISLAGREFILEHGDQMDPEDTGYLFLRWFLRTPVMRLFERSLPGFLVRRIGEWMSSTSRKYTDDLREKLASDEDQRKEKIFQKLKKHVEELSQKGFKFQFHISGHVHQKIQSQISVPGEDPKQDPKIEMINLGTWLGPEKWVGVFTEKDGFYFENQNGSAP